jgi:hypothetical protein
MSCNIDKDRKIQILSLIIEQKGLCNYVSCQECYVAFDRQSCPGEGTSSNSGHVRVLQLAKKKLKEYNSSKFIEDEPQIILNQEY